MNQIKKKCKYFLNKKFYSVQNYLKKVDLKLSGNQNITFYVKIAYIEKMFYYIKF